MNENGTGNIKDGRYIKEGYNAELDELRSVKKNSQQWIANMELSEKEKTGITNPLTGEQVETLITLKFRIPIKFRFQTTILEDKL